MKYDDDQDIGCDQRRQSPLKIAHLAEKGR